MGFDCTLHVVDEEALGRFVDRVLDRAPELSPFDWAFANAEELIRKTRESLDGPEPVRAAWTVAELALLYLSAEGPHVYSRGFSLSLWKTAVMGVALPVECLGSVEPFLGPIVEAHPAIRGKIPRFFTQNWCVGPFVRARDVPQVRSPTRTSRPKSAAMIPRPRLRWVS